MDVPILEILGALACVVFGWLFAGAEAALALLPEPRIREIAQRLGPKAGPLDGWLDRRDRVLATLLVGRNLAKVSATVLLTLVAIRILPIRWAVVAAAAGAVVLLGFGEVVPRALVRASPERWLLPLLFVLRPIEVLFRPLSAILLATGRAIGRVLARRGQTGPPPVTAGELEYLIELGSRSGTLGKERGELLRSVLGFSDTVVKEVMVPRTAMVTIEESTPIDKALEIVMADGHSRIPVYRESLDNVAGTLYAKDLLRAAREGRPASLSELVRRPPHFVAETQKLGSVLREMQARRVHLAVVLDEFGGTSGLVTLEDVLEEIVGEIRDEYDVDEGPVVPVGENTFLADARVSIHDLGEVLGTTLPDVGRYESLGGFLEARAGGVPGVGTRVVWRNLEFTVKEGDNKKVSKVEIVRRAPPAEAPPGE